MQCSRIIKNCLLTGVRRAKVVSFNPPTLVSQSLSLCSLLTMVCFACSLTLPPTPIHPCQLNLVVAFDSPLTRKSWAKHGTRGFDLSASPDRYRCLTLSFPPLPPNVSVRPCPTIPIPSFPSKTPLFSRLSPTPLPRALSPPPSPALASRY
jgi:hypothetical protein